MYFVMCVKCVLRTWLSLKITIKKNHIELTIRNIWRYWSGSFFFNVCFFNWINYGLSGLLRICISYDWCCKKMLKICDFYSWNNLFACLLAQQYIVFFSLDFRMLVSTFNVSSISKPTFNFFFFLFFLFVCNDQTN